MEIIYKYNKQDTELGVVNEISLKLEIRASTIDDLIDVKLIGIEQIGITFGYSLSEEELTLLTEIVNNHQGNQALVDEVNVNQREQKIREMTEMAILHPSLNENDAVEYLTSIDNWLNAWKRCGINTALINKITLDSSDSLHPSYLFLNTVLTVEGLKTFEFLTESITE